jgi:hypothetical protein
MFEEWRRWDWRKVDVIETSDAIRPIRVIHV